MLHGFVRRPQFRTRRRANSEISRDDGLMYEYFSFRLGGNRTHEVSPEEPDASAFRLESRGVSSKCTRGG